MFLIVCLAFGNFLRRSYSEAMGWKGMEKCSARLLPVIKSASIRGRREDIRGTLFKRGRHWVMRTLDMPTFEVVFCMEISIESQTGRLVVYEPHNCLGYSLHVWR
jgi:hypothetical protein